MVWTKVWASDRSLRDEEWDTPYVTDPLGVHDSGLTIFEARALKIFAELLERQHEALGRNVRVVERDRSPIGFIAQLQAPATSNVVPLRNRLARFSVMVFHPSWPKDGIVTLSVDGAGRPVELEAVSFDGSAWPGDDAAFVFDAELLK